MVLPLYDIDVLRAGAVSHLGAVHMDGWGFLQVLLVSLSKGPGFLPYVFLIACEFSTLIPTDDPTLPVQGVLVFQFN